MKISQALCIINKSACVILMDITSEVFSVMWYRGFWINAVDERKRPAVISIAVSPTNEDHRPVLHLRYIEHPCVLFLLPPDCCPYDVQ